MALEVLAGPGCDDVGKEAYIADKLGPDDVVISVGRIFKALTLARTFLPRTRLRSAWRSGSRPRRSASHVSGSYPGSF